MAERNATVRLQVKSDQDAGKGLREVSKAARDADSSVAKFGGRLKDIPATAKTAGDRVREMFEASRKAAADSAKRTDEMTSAVKRLGIATSDAIRMAKQLGREYGLTASQVKAALSAADGGGGGFDRRFTRAGFKMAGLGMVGKLGMGGLGLMMAHNIMSSTSDAFSSAFATDADEEYMRRLRQRGPGHVFAHEFLGGIPLIGGPLRSLVTYPERQRIAEEQRQRQRDDEARREREMRERAIADMRAAGYGPGDRARQVTLRARYAGLAGAEAAQHFAAGRREQDLFGGEWNWETGVPERVLNLAAMRAELATPRSYHSAELATIAEQQQARRAELAQIDARQAGDRAGLSIREQRRAFFASLTPEAVNDAYRSGRFRPFSGGGMEDLLPAHLRNPSAMRPAAESARDAERANELQRQLNQGVEEYNRLLREGAAAQRELGERFSQRLRQEVEGNRAAAVAERERLRHMRIGFGLSDETEQTAILAAAREYAAGGEARLSGESFETMRRRPDLFRQQLEEIGTVRGGPGYDELSRLLGYENRAATYERRAREADQLRIQVDQQLTARLQVDESNLAQELARQLVPQIETQIGRMRAQIWDAFQRQLEEQRAAARGAAGP